MKKTTIIFIFIFLELQLFAPEITQKQYLKQFENFFLYEKVINNLKKSEGLRLKVYICPAGYKTIGYGHKLLKNEHFNIITKKKAEILLKKDFNKRLKLINIKSYNKKLAITHFIFNVGIGHYIRSNLFKKIKSNQNIDKEIIKWCYYTKNGVKIKSSNALKSRLFELKIYNLNITN